MQKKGSPLFLSYYLVDKEHQILKILFSLFLLATFFPLSEPIISEYKFSEHSVNFSYHLNYFRWLITFLAIIYFKDNFRAPFYIKPLFITVIFVVMMGLLLPREIIAFELSRFDLEFVYWLLLQLETVIAEGIIFFILIPKIINSYNLLLIAGIFALAHGLSGFLPLIFLVGLFYAWVLQRYNFRTHLAVHFLFNLLHLVLFTYPKAL